MILVDFSQIVVASFMAQIQGDKNVPIEEDLIRHMILNKLREIKMKFGHDYGEMIIAVDSNSWRKNVFPFYKARRGTDKDNSGINWEKLHQIMSMVGDEINENLTYRYIKVPDAEGDDIIGTLAIKFGNKFQSDDDGPLFSNERTEKILIISGDKDFPQLQIFTNICQYDPTHKRDFIKTDDPIRLLRRHIMKGDRLDGVPNFLSQDDSLVMKIRQKPVYDKKLDEWVNMYPIQFCTPEMLENYERNRKLIDLWNIPEYIQENVMIVFRSQEGKKNNVFNYLMSKGLKKLLESASEF